MPRSKWRQLLAVGISATQTWQLMFTLKQLVVMFVFILNPHKTTFHGFLQSGFTYFKYCFQNSMRDEGQPKWLCYEMFSSDFSKYSMIIWTMMGNYYNPYVVYLPEQVFLGSGATHTESSYCQTTLAAPNFRTGQEVKQSESFEYFNKCLLRYYCRPGHISSIVRCKNIIHCLCW